MIIETEDLGDYYIAKVEMPVPPYSTWGEDWYPEIDAWCEETFGPSDLWGEAPVSGWKRMQHKFYFTDPADRDWFITRWS